MHEVKYPSFSIPSTFNFIQFTMCNRVTQAIEINVLNYFIDRSYFQLITHRIDYSDRESGMRASSVESVKWKASYTFSSQPVDMNDHLTLIRAIAENIDGYWFGTDSARFIVIEQVFLSTILERML